MLNESNSQLRVFAIENHPNDSRVTLRQDGTCQALTGRMGTGGGNVPLVMTYEEIIQPSEA